MEQKTTSSLQVAGRGLLLLAAALSAFLAWQTFSAGGAIAGCGDGAACDNILASSWSRLFGVPVAVFGALFYLSAAALGTLKGAYRVLGLALLITIPAAALWFAGVQWFAIGAFCVWCCSVHLVASCGAVLLLVDGKVLCEPRQAPASLASTRTETEPHRSRMSPRA